MFACYSLILLIRKNATNRALDKKTTIQTIIPNSRALTEKSTCQRQWHKSTTPERDRQVMCFFVCPSVCLCTESVVLFTQGLRIFSGAVVRKFSNDGDSHRAKHLRLHLCNLHRKPVLWLLKRRDGTQHVDDVGVSPGVPPGVPPVNLNPQTVYNHTDAVIMCSD